MSKSKHTNPAYISHVHLKGYKSIIDTEVELHPGLNIIIGPNGSGKTNFLEFLKRLVTTKFIEDRFESTIKISAFSKSHIWKAAFLDNVVNRQDNTIKSKFLEEFNVEGNGKINIREYLLSSFGGDIYGSKKLLKILRLLNPLSFISIGLPNQVKGLDTYLSIQISKQTFKVNYEPSEFSFVANFFLNNFVLKKYNDVDLSAKENLLQQFEIDEEFLRNLRKFTPIKNLRIERGLSINESGTYFNIGYLGFEFLVNDKWLKWEMLSHGTKRLFYIISEITFNNGLCLIEEPEIGLHPNQYDAILNFLKEESYYKQIIITTHAPRTLDALQNDELDRIILTRYDKIFGTKMRHLSQEEIAHIIDYSVDEGLFISDLWTWTSFFDEEEVI